MAGDWDWVKTAVQIVSPLVAGIAGLFLGTHQAGKKTGREDAQAEAKISKEIDDKIERLKVEMRTAVADALDDNKTFIESVGDTFTALRQKINDVEKDGLIRFLPRDDFTNFLKEYRENQRRTDDKLDKLLGLNGHRGN